MMRIRVRRVAMLASSLLALALVDPTATLADRATIGPAWPERPGIVQGLVFSGRIVDRHAARLAGGSRYPAWTMRVERVYAGEVSAAEELVAVCAPITLEVGGCCGDRRDSATRGIRLEPTADAMSLGHGGTGAAQASG